MQLPVRGSARRPGGRRARPDGLADPGRAVDHPRSAPGCRCPRTARPVRSAPSAPRPARRSARAPPGSCRGTPAGRPGRGVSPAGVLPLAVARACPRAAAMKSARAWPSSGNASASRRSDPGCGPVRPRSRFLSARTLAGPPGQCLLRQPGRLTAGPQPCSEPLGLGHSGPHRSERIYVMAQPRRQARRWLASTSLDRHFSTEKCRSKVPGVPPIYGLTFSPIVDRTPRSTIGYRSRGAVPGMVLSRAEAREIPGEVRVRERCGRRAVAVAPCVPASAAAVGGAQTRCRVTVPAERNARE